MSGSNLLQITDVGGSPVTPLAPLAPLTETGFDSSAASYGVSFLGAAASAVSPEAAPLISALTGSGPTTASGTQPNFWSDIFLRSVVIILGFIFVAIGLSMFKKASS